MYRAIDKWLWGYLQSVARRPRRVDGPRHLLFCVADHFEPLRGMLPPGGAVEALPEGTLLHARKSVEDWARQYSGMAAAYRDADGRPPRHTFFYPQEEYDADCLNALASLCSQGYGEVEVHLHHRHDTAEGLRRKLAAYRDLLHERHGLLGTNAEGRVRYGFVHGNWSLCNSRPDGDWCGVNEELGVLAETGCYADFTFPSAPSPTQPRMVNAIYRARDAKGRPRGHDRGERVEVGGWRLEVGGGKREEGSGKREEGSGKCPPSRRSFGVAFGEAPREGGRWDVGGGRVEGGRGKREEGSGKKDGDQREGDEDFSREEARKIAKNGKQPSPLAQVSRLRTEATPRHAGLRSQPSSLLLITGPLALDWRRRKWGALPRLENAEISGGNPPTPERVDLWARQGIGVVGRPDWVFVKVHTHGLVSGNRRVLLGDDIRRMHAHLQSRYNDGTLWRLHYVTAREMYNLVRAAEEGESGPPGVWRDYEVRLLATQGKTYHGGTE